MLYHHGHGSYADPKGLQFDPSRLHDGGESYKDPHGVRGWHTSWARLVR